MILNTRTRPAVADSTNVDTIEPHISQMTFWEKTAATRWGRYITEVEERAIMRGQSLAGKPTRALDIGCEGGRWAKFLSDLGWQMTCVEVNPQILAVCQQRVPTAQCILSDPHNKILPCDSNSMALLLCIEVAPVIESDWFLAEAARVLRDGGVLVGVAWNKASIRGLASRALYKTRRKKYGEFYKGNYQTFKGKLHKANFEIVEEEGFCWGPFGRASNSPLIPLFTKLERLLLLNRLTALSPWIAFAARKAPPRGS